MSRGTDGQELEAGRQDEKVLRQALCVSAFCSAIDGDNEWVDGTGRTEVGRLVGRQPDDLRADHCRRFQPSTSLRELQAKSTPPFQRRHWIYYYCSFPCVDVIITPVTVPCILRVPSTDLLSASTASRVKLQKMASLGLDNNHRESVNYWNVFLGYCNYHPRTATVVLFSAVSVWNVMLHRGRQLFAIASNGWPHNAPRYHISSCQSAATSEIVKRCWSWVYSCKQSYSK